MIEKENHSMCNPQWVASIGRASIGRLKSGGDVLRPLSDRPTRRQRAIQQRLQVSQRLQRAIDLLKERVVVDTPCVHHGDVDIALLKGDMDQFQRICPVASPVVDMVYEGKLDTLEYQSKR